MSASTEAPVLTEREFAVVQGMSRGRSNAEIGDELGLSEDRVKNHCRSLFWKLGARDRAHAVALCYQRGLLVGAGVPGPAADPAAPLTPVRREPAEALIAPQERSGFADAVGMALRAERQRHGWTLADTGQPLGLLPPLLSRLELGRRPLDMNRLAGWCAVLGVPPTWVIAVAQQEAFPVGWRWRSTKPPQQPQPSGGTGATELSDVDDSVAQLAGATMATVTVIHPHEHPYQDREDRR